MLTASIDTADPERRLAPVAEPTNAETAQAKILDALVCPITRSAVDVIPLERAGHAIRSGAIFSRELDRMIGRIENFQIDFVRPGEAHSREALERDIQTGAIPKIVNSVPEWRIVPYTSDEIRYSGSKVELEKYEMVAIEQAGSTASFEASGEIDLLLFAHPWSGLAEIRHLYRVRTVDLYEPHTVVPRPIRLDLGPQRQRVEIKATGKKNELSFGRQCLFGGFRQRTGALVPLRHQKEAKVRGAPFSPEFHQLMAAVPPSGLLIDLGGGNRQIDDSRYVNIDYADYTEPDLVADATLLPLRDASVDAVYSTGVFEHINDPFKAGAEVARISKPGGRAIVGWAFMQPIHSEGQHFYNATPWGVERAFSALEVKRMWYQTSFAFLVQWGASVSGLPGLVPSSEIEAVCDILRRWDSLIPETHKQYMANGVFCELEKT